MPEQNSAKIDRQSDNQATDTISTNSNRSLKELFIIFFIFSLLGHYLEVVWAWAKFFAVGSTWYPKINDLIPLAAPYGLGTVALILIIWPIMKSRKLSPIIVVISSGLLAGVVEVLCALVVILLYGKNFAWDYSNNFLNFYGLTCLSACVLFAIASVIFLYFLYPHFEKLFESFKKRQISIIFWVLFVAYFVNLLLILIRDSEKILIK